jgi:inner membrane transporter RhtA
MTITSDSRSPRPLTPAPALALGSIAVLQLGTALSTTLFRSLGTTGTTWLTLSIAGLFFLGVVRHPWAGVSRQAALTSVTLGAVAAGTSLAFLASLHRLPLGTASAIEFLGPLSIPMWRARTGRALLWPVLAGGGVLLLTRPWEHGVNLTGVALALVAAGFWAAYIPLGQRSGDHHDGIAGLALALPFAAVVAAPFGALDAVSHLTPARLAVAGAVALLDLIVPYSLELLALRRMDLATFGTLMCFDPALGAVVGLTLLGQPLFALDAVGIALVVVAGIGATRAGPGAHRHRR